MTLTVTKRSDQTEQFDLDKIHQVLFWASEGVSNVSVSEIEIKSRLQFIDKMKTTDIQNVLIQAAASLISKETPDYSKVATNLINISLRKQIYNSYVPPELSKQYTKVSEMGLYSGELHKYFNDHDWTKLNNMIDHDRDRLLMYASIEAWRTKYLVQNRSTGDIYETPQFAYILIAATLFKEYPKQNRMKYIRDFYNAISKGSKSTITLASPILAGIRTPTKQFSSCVKIETGDSLNSISTTGSAIIQYASKKAGIGLNFGKIRAIGAEVRKDTTHTGVLPFLKFFTSALKSCSQGGLRTSSATALYPMFTYEFEDIIVLKNNKGVEENRVRDLDYGVQLNGYLLKRCLEDKPLTLFSMHEVPELYKAFFDDQDKFAELYEQYERKTSIMKKTISAKDALETIMTERMNTGRIYIQFVDHSNSHSSFTVPVKMTNLCCEITLPTTELTKESLLPATTEMFDMSSEDFGTKYGEIALCTLAAINYGAIDKPEDLEQPCDLAVRALDELLSYQNYPMCAAEVPTINRRSLGVGIANLSYFLAKRKLKFSDGSANDTIHEYMEAMQYNLIKTSATLASEVGKCKWFYDTKYSKGIFPIDTYNKNVDSIVGVQLKQDWDQLREYVAEHGLRNSTLSAIMPVDSSAVHVGAVSSGVDPIRSLEVSKLYGDSKVKMIAPEAKRLKQEYEKMWDMPDTTGHMKLIAIITKFLDQAASYNTFYDPSKYHKNIIPMSVLMGDLVMIYKLGIKTMYYQTTDDNSGDIYEVEESECESCKL